LILQYKNHPSLAAASWLNNSLSVVLPALCTLSFLGVVYQLTYGSLGLVQQAFAVLTLYGPHSIFASAMRALILSLFVSQPALRAVALIAIWWLPQGRSCSWCPQSSGSALQQQCIAAATSTSPTCATANVVRLAHSRCVLLRNNKWRPLLPHNNALRLNRRFSDQMLRNVRSMISGAWPLRP